ncbi:prolyl 4-hydroxylase subunit alpha-1-like [Drosophila pseudoobscura]|uniref:procollagen-proline 4-dioxygenase n=1 Tax=Drosophila pseudoobscura pseudoobscura TaxID=46245 RepID=A0A6I8V1V5_DROPS|nr:prolyl 4-hydroxylase subunit alpha-1 [Drosophila pseudoobscura]
MLLVLLFYICACSADEEADYSLAVDSLGELIPLERYYYGNLSAFADKMEAKLITIRRALSKMRPVLEAAEDKQERFVGNPLHAYSLLRHLHHDWPNWLDFVEEPVGAEEIKHFRSLELLLPSRADIADAAFGLEQIRDMYGQTERDMAIGLLDGQQHNVQLTAMDCWSLGKHYFHLKSFVQASVWLGLAADRYNVSEEDIYAVQGFHRVELWQLQAGSLMRQSRNDDALAVINGALEKLPFDMRLLSLRSRLENRWLVRPRLDYEEDSLPAVTDVQRGCRGEYPWKSTLHCRFSWRPSFYARLKVEEVLLDPYIVLYHDVVSGKEMELLKDYGRTNLTHDPLRSGLSAKHCALPESLPLVQSLHQRLWDMTGLSLNGSESWLITNYGIGGFLGLHKDYFDEIEEELQGDNRLFTIQIFLSNVSQGGYTVFPNLEVAVKPQAGTALVFYNLLDSLVGDTRTRHFGCPVIDGDKWIATKFLSAKEQTLRRRGQ